MTRLTPQRRNLVLALAALAIVLGYELWSWGSLEGFAMATHAGGCRDASGGLQVFCDAVRFYLPQGEALAEGHGRVRGFLYPPPFALLMRALVALGRPAALDVWVGVVALSMVGLFAVPATALFSGSRPASISHAIFFATAMPLFGNFYWGQVSALVALLVVSALILHARGRKLGCALLLGIATALKVYPALFAAPLLLRRDFRTVGAAALVAIVLACVLPPAFLGVGGTLLFYQGASTDIDGAIRSTPLSYYGPNVLSMLLTGRVRLDSQLIGFLQQGAICVVIANLSLLRRLVRLQAPLEPFWAASLLFCSLPFFVRTSWLHSYSYLPFVQSFALYAALRARGYEGYLKGALVSCVILSGLLSSYAMFNIVGDEPYYVAHAYVFWASLLVLIVLHGLGWKLASGAGEVAVETGSDGGPYATRADLASVSALASSQDDTSFRYDRSTPRGRSRPGGAGRRRTAEPDRENASMSDRHSRPQR